jgi:hypothetical protein
LVFAHFFLLHTTCEKQRASWTFVGFIYILSSTGCIKWVRSLHSHLEDLVIEASSHPVLKTLPATSELLRHYSTVATALINYEADLKETWMKQNVSLHCEFHKASQLNDTLLVHDPTRYALTD